MISIPDNDYGNSSFWLDKSLKSQSGSSDIVRLYRLASRKKAISNFVSIVTSKKIPVVFESGGSYTDGNTVVISSKVEKPEDFDVAVGLALHEGSHIKLSDFEILNTLMAEIIVKTPNWREFKEKCQDLGVDIQGTVKDLLNWVEDRRIDNFIYSTSPGYRGYYQKLYDTYFNSKSIEMGLQSEYATDETLESYMFRIINLQSRSTHLNALKGLGEISDIANLPNIGRLNSTDESLDIALQIFDVVLKYIDPQPTSQEPDPGDGSEDSDSDSKPDKSGKSSGKKSKSGDENTVSDTVNDTVSDTVSDGENGDSTGTESDHMEFEPTTKLTDNLKRKLESEIRKQKDFLDGKIKKSKVSKEDSENIETLANVDADIVEVGTDYKNSNIPSLTAKVNKVECIFVKSMDENLLRSTKFPLTSFHVTKSYNYELTEFCEDDVNEGIVLGKVLGRKLQTRSEERDTVFNRQLVGKLDKRMISSLGYGNTHAFYTREISRYNKANLHVSIDSSSSMAGIKWKNTMKNVVSLITAVDMIPGLEIQVTFRSTSSDNTPYIVLAYDSRVDKLSKVKSMFKYLRPYGTTPEGLCFEAITKHMVQSTGTTDSYFLNISDGEPYYFMSSKYYYTGMDAARHTRDMINNIRKMGINVLSYYVSDYPKASPNMIFTECYGKSAKAINVTSMNEVSRTMNELFMKK